MLSRCLINLIFFCCCLPAYGQSKEPKIWNISLQLEAFTGRENQLSYIKEALLKDYLVSIVGLAGIGKTILAKEYATRNKRAYDVVWFIDLNRDLDGQLLELALELKNHNLITADITSNDVHEGAKMALTWLRSAKMPWLLIFDNVGSEQNLQPYFPDIKNQLNKHIILTSKYRMHDSKMLHIGSFSDIESMDYLKPKLGEKYSDGDIKLLAETLGNHPRALLQASSYIAAVPGMNCQKYVSAFTKGSKKLSEEEKMVLTKQEASVEIHTTLEIQLEKLAQDSPDSLIFLAMLSYMSYSHISDELLLKAQDVVKHHGQLTYKYLIKPSFLVKEGDGYAIHPYVAAVVQSYLSTAQKKISLENGMGVLASYLDESMDNNLIMFGEKPDILSHIMDITAHYDGICTSATDLEVAALFYLFYPQRRYDLATPLSERCRDRIERRGSNLPSLSEGRFYSLYSFMIYDSGTLAEAIQTNLKAEAILEKIDGLEAKEELILLLCNNLSAHYLAQGNISKIQACVDKAEKLLGDDISQKNKLFLLANRFNIALDDGKFELAKECLRMIEGALPGNPLEKSVSHIISSNRAKLAIKEKDMAIAKESAAKGFQMALESVGNDEKHETVSRVGMFLALCELYDGNILKAERLADNAIEGFTKSYSSDSKHRMQAYAHMVKGDVLMAKGDHDGAKNSYKKALQIYELELTNMKIDDVSELYERFINLGLLTQDENLATDYRDKHFGVFGIKHFRSHEIIKKF